MGSAREKEVLSNSVAYKQAIGGDFVKRVVGIIDATAAALESGTYTLKDINSAPITLSKGTLLNNVYIHIVNSLAVTTTGALTLGTTASATNIETGIVTSNLGTDGWTYKCSFTAGSTLVITSDTSLRWTFTTSMLTGLITIGVEYIDMSDSTIPATRVKNFSNYSAT